MTSTSKILILILLAIFPVMFFSCRKFVEIPPGPNLIVGSEVFSDSTDANAALLGVYLFMVGSASSPKTYNANITLYTGLSSDEINPTRNIPTERAIFQNALFSTNTAISTLWSDTYTLIYRANACIEGLTGNTGISDPAKNQFLGEAKVMRAFFYFNLVNLYGSVPLVISTDYRVNDEMKRTSADSVYNQIIDDLISAESLLLPQYPTDGKARINRFTASALLARVYLYKQMWANAETEASEVINSGMYELETDLNKVFLANSNEAIWQLIPAQAGYETAEGYLFVPATTNIRPKYVISDFLLNAIDPGDQRKVNWMNANDVGGQSYYYPYKYKLGIDNNTTPAENYMVFRLAEQYLIRAEARAQLNNLDDASTDLNMIRHRAGLSDTTAATKEDILKLIFHERQIEFFCEWGHRWYDLKRSGLADGVMSAVTPVKGGTWNSNWQLYPISMYELLNNPFLNQNPGYN